MDRAVAYRDAFDLGCLILAHGAIPQAAISKAEAAYGANIARKLRWVVDRLVNEHEVEEAAKNLQMDGSLALTFIDHVRSECARLWPPGHPGRA